MRSAEFVVDHAKMGISRDDDVSRRAARILRATREDPYPVQVHGIEPAVLHPTAIEAPSRKQRAERRRTPLGTPATPAIKRNVVNRNCPLERVNDHE